MSPSATVFISSSVKSIRSLPSTSLFLVELRTFSRTDIVLAVLFFVRCWWWWWWGACSIREIGGSFESSGSTYIWILRASFYAWLSLNLRRVLISASSSIREKELDSTIFDSMISISAASILNMPWIPMLLLFLITNLSSPYKSLSWIPKGEVMSEWARICWRKLVLQRSLINFNMNELF